MSELPKNWILARLDECLELINGRAYSQPELLHAGTPVLRIQNLNGGDRWYYSDLTLGPEKYCNTGDLLYAWSATFGPYVYSGPRAIYHYHIWKVLPQTNIIDKSFAFYTLRRITDEVKAAAHGVAMPHMTKAGMERWPIVLPPLAEQHRIVAKIETLTTKSRRAKEALDAVPPLLERFRKAVLAAAFRGDLTAEWREKNPDVEPAEELLKRIRAERRRRWEEAELAKMRAKGKVPGDDRWKERYEEPEPVDASELPELPDRWCWAPAAGVVAGDADIMYGIIQPGPVVADGVPYVRGMDIEDGNILEHQLLRTHPDIAARYARASLEGGDILLGIIRATKVAIVPSSLRGANITQGTARFRPASGILTEYLAGWLESPWAQDWLHSKYRGIDMPGLNLRDVRLLPVPIAPAEEQRAIAEILKSQRRRQASLGPLIRSLLQSVTEIDAAILAKAFRGELVPQDPNDEPASVLLERLRAETALDGKSANGANSRPKAALRESRKSNSSAIGRKIGARPR